MGNRSICVKNFPAKINKIYGIGLNVLYNHWNLGIIFKGIRQNLLVDTSKKITLLGVLCIFININPEASALIATMIILAALAYPVVRTKKELKDKFNNKI